MAKKKVESDLVRIDSVAEVDNLLSEYSTLAALQQKLTAKYNEEEQKRRLVLSEQTAPIEARMKTLEQSFEAWAANNRQEFGDKKSMSLTHGLLAFRTTPPSVKTLKGWTLASALELIKRAVSLKSRFVRTAEEIDREAILRAFSAWQSDPKDKEGVSEKMLREVGLEIKQTENFYVEPKFAVEVA